MSRGRARSTPPSSRLRAGARAGLRGAVFDPGAADIDVNELHQGFLRGLRARGGQ